jgi:hypothetical protein
MKMQASIRDTRRTPNRPRPVRFSPGAVAKGEQKTPSRRPKFARATIGFWLGGGIGGMGGCILGVCMPYHHLVAVVVSALWWGIYLGCLGGSLGGLLGLCTSTGSGTEET